MLRYYCGLTEADTPAVMLAKIRRTLQEVGVTPDEGALLLLHLLGVQTDMGPFAALRPEALKSRTFATLRHICMQASQQQPLVVEIENLHWIDPTSDECLAALIEGVAGVPILILVTYRPGYRSAWMDRSYVTQIALQRLSPQDSWQVIQSVMQTTAIAESLVQQLLVKADGNPFFLEELAWTVREHGNSHGLTLVPATAASSKISVADRCSDWEGRELVFTPRSQRYGR
jgi:predicted ATPase